MDVDAYTVANSAVVSSQTFSEDPEPSHIYLDHVVNEESEDAPAEELSFKSREDPRTTLENLRAGVEELLRKSRAPSDGSMLPQAVISGSMRRNSLPIMSHRHVFHTKQSSVLENNMQLCRTNGTNGVQDCSHTSGGGDFYNRTTFTITSRCEALNSDQDSYTRGTRRLRRAHSEPPVNRKSQPQCATYMGATLHGNTSDDSNAANPGSRLNLWAQDGSQKRKERDEDSGEGSASGNDHDGRGNGFRKRRDVGMDSLDKQRLPCIFYAGERESYASHTKRYEHISQLLSVSFHQFCFAANNANQTALKKP